MRDTSPLWRGLALTVVGAMLAGCSPSGKPGEGASSRETGTGATLSFAAYSTPKEAYTEEIIPAFRKLWKAKTGQDVTLNATYDASGAQARNVVNGLEADVVALSMEPDIAKIEKAGLITHEWRQGPYHGIVTRSVVGLLTRKGNPKGLRQWSDLTRPGVEILTPNPNTSGGAKWNLLAVYGAALSGKQDATAAEQRLAALRKNIIVMDKSGRESLGTFLHGAGDVAITYENEALRALKENPNQTFITPTATILIENPAAVVDRYADKHGVRKVAEAFVAFLTTRDAQRAYARHHYRPVDPTVSKETATQFPNPSGLFTVRDLGGWSAVQKTVFETGAAWDRAAAR